MDIDKINELEKKIEKDKTFRSKFNNLKRIIKRKQSFVFKNFCYHIRENTDNSFTLYSVDLGNSVIDTNELNEILMNKLFSNKNEYQHLKEKLNLNLELIDYIERPSYMIMSDLCKVYDPKEIFYNYTFTDYEELLKTILK